MLSELINECRPRLDPWVKKIPWRRKWKPIWEMLNPTCACLGNPMVSEARWATVHEVSRARHDLTTKPIYFRIRKQKILVLPILIFTFKTVWKLKLSNYIL